jgi:serine/threonine-protein kinase
MPQQLDKRAARMLVERFGADPRRVRQIYLETVQARKRGQAVDLMESFLRAQLLTPQQAAELREALDQTQIDPSRPVRSRPEKEVTFELTAGNDRKQAPNRPQPGVPYRVLRQLGEGGMGQVYLAYDEPKERLVAIKVLWAHLAENPALLERFNREVQHSCKLEHPNIVRGLDCGTDASTRRPYLVMEYVDGPSAQSLLDRRGKIPIGDAVHIALDIARALEHAHSRNIVHRDIKPENILITRTGLAKLADLGLSKATDQVSHLTATRQGFGTPYYMPYEQAMNARTADARSDIYALGATLYHMITGQVPFRGENQVDILEKKEAGAYPPASLINPEVPPELDLIIDKMLARDRQDRYQTASELIVDLERSRLAVPVLSFVDPDAAMADPVVRARAVLAHQVTQPDLQLQQSNRPRMWALQYVDRGGNLHDSTLTTEQVLQRIKQGTINGAARASPNNGREFHGLEHYPVFRDAVRAQMRHADSDKRTGQSSVSAAMPRHDDPDPRPQWGTWLFAGGIALIILILTAFLLILVT